MPRSFNKTLLFINSIFVLAATAVLAAQDTSATVSGEIRDATGAAISLGEAELRLQTSPHTLFSVGMKEDGRFKFTVLPAGAYTLSVSIQGFYGLTVKSIQLASGEQKILLPLRLDPAPSGCAAGPIVEYLELLPTAQNVGNLKGRVVRDGHHPIASVTVTLHCEEQPICGQTKTNINGEFTFLNLTPEQQYTMRFNRQGYYSGYEKVYSVQPGYDSIYEPVILELCPNGNCDPKLRRKRPLIVCE